MFAAEKGRLDAVRLLIDRGVDVLVVDRRNESALDKARRKEKEDVIDSLREEVAFQLDTEAAYREFLKDFPNHGRISVRLQRLLYERALQSNLLADWEAVSDFGPGTWGYVGDTWTSFTGELLKPIYDNAQNAISNLRLYEGVLRDQSVDDFMNYLKGLDEAVYLSTADREARRQEVHVLFEPRFLAWARETNSGLSYRRYLTYLSGRV